jgi:hypothetical protein
MRGEFVVASERWEQSVIKAALGKDAAAVLSEAIRQVELRARVPRYQREVRRALAQREGMSVDVVLTRELEDVARAYRDELVALVAAALRGRRERVLARIERSALLRS